MKAYTDLEQSKKLAKILPLESADMHYNNVSIKGVNYVDEYRAELMEYNRAIKVLSKYTINPLFGVTPCWSLAVLYSLLPEQTDISKSYSDNCETIIYWCWNSAFDIETKEYDNPVDACVEMILKLNELKML